MAEKPILFSGEMVKAVLAGRKTQTRRVVKPQPNPADWQRITPEGWRCPYGSPGGTLWVREAFWECNDNNNDRHHYVADGPAPTTERRHYRKRPSIFMPRTLSRINLLVTDVRVERVQEITPEDIVAEGAWRAEHSVDEDCSQAYEAWQDLWDSINAKRGFGWDTNPWVWVVDFERAKEGAPIETSDQGGSSLRSLTKKHGMDYDAVTDQQEQIDLETGRRFDNE